MKIYSFSLKTVTRATPKNPRGKVLIEIPDELAERLMGIFYGHPLRCGIVTLEPDEPDLAAKEVALPMIPIKINRRVRK